MIESFSVFLTLVRLLAVLGLVMPSIVLSDSVTGKVVAVSDGDTVTVLDRDQNRYKVRLQGIDAPEKRQPFGQRSKEHLSKLVFARNVFVEYNKRDRYGRIVGRVVLDGIDANLQQLHAGMAWHYKEYEREQPVAERTEYSRAERVARQNRNGLWVDVAPVPPWEFRRKTR
ncbi:thermonuclease family protein [Hydrogenophaga sp. OTU3427]|uniref:thermonuclease family protein n=1 Tax=Hydrogenophaga sp. OTU3427 TaxID=3043856 RepID=UPI00313BC575